MIQLDSSVGLVVNWEELYFHDAPYIDTDNNLCNFYIPFMIQDGVSYIVSCAYADLLAKVEVKIKDNKSLITTDYFMIVRKDYEDNKLVSINLVKLAKNGNLSNRAIDDIKSYTDMTIEKVYEKLKKV